MLHLTHAIDRASGYVYTPASTSVTSHPPDAIPPDKNTPASHHPNTYSLFSSAMGPLKGPMSDVRDVQERWVDARDAWDAFEKRAWRAEVRHRCGQCSHARRLLSSSDTLSTEKLFFTNADSVPLQCCASYHHSPSIPETTRALASFLKPGGSLLVADIKAEEDGRVILPPKSIIISYPTRGG